MDFTRFDCCTSSQTSNESQGHILNIVGDAPSVCNTRPHKARGIMRHKICVRLCGHHHPDVAGHLQRDVGWGNWPATETKRKGSKQYCTVCNTVVLLALPTKAKDIVFRFIIEYSSLRDFL